METLIKNIDNTIIDCNKVINENILGINFLEQLKYSLIDNLKINKSTLFQDIANNELTKIYGKKNLIIKIDNFEDSLSKIKNIVPNDCLCIVLKGSKSLEIYSNYNDKLTNNLNLFPMTGVVLSKDTITNESIFKDTILLNIYCINEKIDIENKNLI